MRRIQLILAALAIVVSSLAAFSGPAMADDLNNCRDARGNLIRCDGDLYRPYNHNNNYRDNYYSFNPYYYSFNPYYSFFNPYSYYSYDNSCPFWGDTSGIINQWDCFD